jgi:hypothetical protein
MEAGAFVGFRPARLRRAAGFTAVIACACLVATGAAADPPAESAPRVDQAVSDDPRGFLLDKMREVAQSGHLADPEFVAATLGIPFQAEPTKRLSSARCPADRSLTASTDVTRYVATGQNWFVTLPGGTRRATYPATDISPPLEEEISPVLEYHVIVMTSCPGVMALDKETSATLEFRGLPAFACIRNVDDHLASATRPRRTDGTATTLFRGKHDDYTGTDLTFYYRSGFSCAVTATLVEEDRMSNRFERATQKYRACLDSARDAYCAAHPSSRLQAQSAPDGMNADGIAHCGRFAEFFRREPYSGEQPAPGPIPISYQPAPCS